MDQKEGIDKNLRLWYMIKTWGGAVKGLIPTLSTKGSPSGLGSGDGAVTYKMPQKVQFLPAP